LKTLTFDQTWVEKTLNSLSLDEKIGQVLMFRQFGWSKDEIDTTERDLARFQPGGHFTMRATVEGLLLGMPRLSQTTRIPLLFASDFESGPAHIMFCGARFPRPMCRGRKGTAKDEYEMGRITAVQGRAMGAQLTFNPVLDLNTHPLNPDVNVRAYGDDLRTVTRLAIPHIQGLQDHGMLAAPKHFPGNGGTSMDPHLSPAVINTSASRYRKNWIEAYRRAFAEADPAALMAGFIVVPSIMSERDPRTGSLIPASLSRQMLTDLLRGELGFKGLIVTDALNMGGAINVFSREELPAKALAAGADMLLCFDGVGVLEPEVKGLRRALERGELKEERLNDAVRHVLEAKAKAGLDRERTTFINDEEKLRAVLAPEPALNRRIVRKGLTVLANRAGTLPLRDLAGKRVFMINTYNPGRQAYFDRGNPANPDTLADGLRARGAVVEALDIEDDSPAGTFGKALAKVAEADLTFFNFFIMPSWAIGHLTPPKEAVRTLFGGILTIGKIPPVITLFGDPYARQFCHTAPTCVCTFDDTRETFEAIVKVWCGEQPARGRMPVSMEGIFKRGDGVDLG
jgi:beta-N-acetylhexosaminidase